MGYSEYNAYTDACGRHAWGEKSLKKGLTYNVAVATTYTTYTWGQVVLILRW